MNLKKLRKNIKILDSINISNNNKCFVVAEISANHSGNLNILKKNYA